MKRTALAAALLIACGAAFANHCPKDMAQIDAALAKNPKLSEADMKAVKESRMKGEELHKAGKHAESVAELQKAEKILGLEPIK